MGGRRPQRPSQRETLEVSYAYNMIKVCRTSGTISRRRTEIGRTLTQGLARDCELEYNGAVGSSRDPSLVLDRPLDLAGGDDHLAAVAVAVD